MAARGVSTKEKLLSLIDDVEVITKEVLESIMAPKHDKPSHADQAQLIQLLLSKNEDVKETIQVLAREQAEIEEKARDLQYEVTKQDQEIQVLQKHLKETETLLSSALYQAKQKYDQILKAQQHSVGSEDLIRFAHRISSTNAVAAPMNWQPGDPRRPYPTDIEMRMGWLGRLNDLPGSTPPTALLDSLPSSLNNANNLGNPFPSWHPHAHHSGSTPDHPMGVSVGLFHPPAHSSPTVGIDPSTRNHEDVEVMSTDSSSSSSSDSQ